MAIRFCGDLARWKSSTASVLVFSSCPSAHMNGVCIHMAATSMTMLRSAWDLETKLLIFLFFFIFVLLICLDPAASCVVSKPNKEDLSAYTTNMNACGDDVHDRVPVRQGHVSVFLFTPFEVACEPFASQLCLLSALTRGRFASSLCLCLCQLGLAGTGRSPRRDSSLDDTPTERATLLSQSTSHTGAQHCLNNRISGPAYRRSHLLLHWTSHRVDRASTSLLGTTRGRLLRMPRASTSQPGTIRLHLQGTIFTLPPSLTLN